MIKRISAITAALALATVGFIVPANAATTEADCGKAGAFCVGLVTDLGQIDDKSFNQAASEASISRLYGGIHYRAAIENGVEQGTNLANYINKKINFFKSK